MSTQQGRILEQLRKKQLVILHIGNIANNAHNAAFIDRKNGLNSYAISANYDHVMGFPFWENEMLELEEEYHFEGKNIQKKFYCPDFFIFGSWDEICSEIKKKTSMKNPNDLGIDFRIKNLYLTLYRIFAKAFKKYAPQKLIDVVIARMGKHLRSVYKDSFNEVINIADFIIFYGPANFMATENNISRKFASVEHGTIRDYIWSKSEVANNSLTAYKNSEVIQVTNQDNFSTASSLIKENGLVLFSPHPTLDEDLQDLRSRRENLIQKHLPGKILIPARHSKQSTLDPGKGLEELIIGFSELMPKYKKLTLHFFEWGNDVERTKKLISEHQLNEFVFWSPIVSRKKLKMLMSESLAVIDQLRIPAFGAISTDAIGIGVPLLTANNGKIDSQVFPSKPPIFTTSNVRELISNIDYLMSPNFNQIDYFRESCEWYDQNLSSNIAFNSRLTMYQHLLNADNQ